MKHSANFTLNQTGFELSVDINARHLFGQTNECVEYEGIVIG